MKSAVWILVSLLFSGHTIDGFGVQHDGGHESGRHVPQTRTTRYVDSASGSWNTNIGYTSTKETEGGVLEGLLDAVSSSTSGKGPGSDQVNAKGSFQIKVDAGAASTRPTAILGSVLSNAASAVGSLSDLAKKNIDSKRNFRGSFALEGNSYLGANGHNFADHDHFGTNGHDATTSTKVVTVASQSQITSNSEAVNGFKTEGRRKDSGFTEHFSGNVDINGGIRNGQNEEAISEKNLGLQKEIIISSLPSISTDTTSTFRGSRVASSNFGSQFSGRKDGSNSAQSDDQVATGRNYFSKIETSQPHILIAGTPATQFRGNLEYENNESSSGHGHRTLSANAGSSGFTSSIEEDGGVITHAQEGAANIQNLKTASQTSSFKTYTSSKGNLHDNSQAVDYKDNDKSIETEDYATISQKEVTGKSGQHVLSSGKFDIKTAEEKKGLSSQYSGIEHTSDYDSSSESEEEDSTYLHEAEHFTGNTGQGRSAQSIPHPTLLNFRPDSDYIDSDESEEIEDNGSEVVKTLSVSSQVNQARPTIEFQKGITGDYLDNLREQGSSGYEGTHSESSASSDFKNQEKLSGTKLVKTEISTTTHFNDNTEDFSEYRTGYPSYLLQESSSKKIVSNVRSNNKNGNDDSSEIGRHHLAGVEIKESSTSFGKHSDNSGLVEKDEYEYTSGFASNQEAVRQGKTLGGSFTGNTRGFSKPSTSEDKEENNYATSVTITSSNQQNLGRASGRSEKSQFYAGQVARRGYNQNYDENEGSTNRRLFEESRQVITSSEGSPRSSFALEPEGKRRLIASSGGKHFESLGEVEDTVLGNSEHKSSRDFHQFRSNVYPIVDDRSQNSRAVSNYGPESEYFHVHPVPGTKIVRKEITETVHTGGDPRHEFEHKQIHRTPPRRIFNEGGFGPISQPDILSTDRQLRELHHGHDHDRLEGRILNRRSQQGFLGSFDSPHNVQGDIGFGPQDHILGEIHSHGGGREFDQFHSAPISYPGDGHEGGRVGFRKIVKVTHEIEDVPRHGREIEFGHGHYYH